MALVRKLSDPLYDVPVRGGKVRHYYQPFGQPRPWRKYKFRAEVEVDIGAADEVDFIRLGKRLPREKGGMMIPVPKADLRLHFNKGQLVEIEFTEKGMIPQRILRQEKST